MKNKWDDDFDARLKTEIEPNYYSEISANCDEFSLDDETARKRFNGRALDDFIAVYGDPVKVEVNRKKSMLRIHGQNNIFVVYKLKKQGKNGSRETCTVRFISNSINLLSTNYLLTIIDS